MRVSIKLRGEANAQALFDVMAGQNRNVIWKQLKAGWHTVDFDYISQDVATVHILNLFPSLKFSCKTI